MNRNILLYYCWLCFFPIKAFCQTDTLTTFHDVNWTKVDELSKAEYIRKAYVHDIGFWKITDYYKSGQVYMIGTFFDKDVQEPVGLLEWFYLSGRVRYRRTYSEGKPVGEYIDYYENGQVDTYKLLDNSGQIVEEKYYKEEGTDSVVENPEFPGGTDAMFKYISENIKYPRSLRKRWIRGKVNVAFVVHTNGSIQDISVIASPHELLSKEAMRVMLSMPRWKPGLRDGKLQRVKQVQPIRFDIE